MHPTMPQPPSLYQPLRPSMRCDLPVRHLRYRVHTWGQPREGVPPLVLLHGWMDVGASWQFVVDALGVDFFSQRYIIAPDWRGFGHSMPAAPCDHYSLYDYLGDLDALLDHIAPCGQAVDLVGHSMGGHMVMLYAGIQPTRVRRVVNLEGFGLPAARPEHAPARLRHWMQELRQYHAGTLTLRTYDSRAAVAERLRKTNPRLPAHQALWLAGEWATPVTSADPGASPVWQLLGDPAHKLINPHLFRLDETLACYSRITAPVLAVHAGDDTLPLLWPDSGFTLAQYHERLRGVPRCRTACVSDAGHMLHHDQPVAVAGLVQDFLTAADPCAPAAADACLKPAG